MSLYLKKEDVLEEVKNRPNSIFHFFRNNTKGICFFTICNVHEELEFAGVLTMSEGVKFLLDYVLWKQEITLEGDIDTIKIIDKNQVIGFFRNENMSHVIHNNPDLVEELLFELLLLYKSYVKKLQVQYETNFMDESKITFSGDHESCFTVQSKGTQKKRMKYLFKKLMECNKEGMIQECDDWYYFNDVIFSKAAFGIQEKSFLSKAMNTNSNSGYVEGKTSSLMFELYRRSIQESNPMGRRLYRKN